MEVKDAVRIAKSYVADVFSEENIGEIGLEEVDFVEAQGVWRITIGFRRPWTKQVERKGPLSAFQPYDLHNRWYKVVVLDDASARVVALKDRELSDAA